MWQTSAVAPACKFGREGIDVVIGYDYGGETQELRIPGVVWLGLAEAIAAGRLKDLDGGWLAWSLAGGRARVVDGYVHLAYGYLHRMEARLPASVWQQITAAVRAHAVDALPVIEADAECQARAAREARAKLGGSVPGVDGDEW
ncbi:hypothetical protein ND748_11300 [Frankia sp. AiPs1]|uniref:hypothetical protein n=1 Tax=Frankia sp. AiPs1 TaxID=573493 RepID=UPI0020446370|nr:hypothetical protein [Frankia sp. AiPs1]MCM3922240.1 hypothetical protein [Frankia sp. AiPs1]